MTEQRNLKTFISYSWDTDEHKEWVKMLASELRQRGIDVILDDWDTVLGDDLTLFMEQGLTNSEKVLMVCTDEYVRKAEAGLGGVGYERMIVTSELVRQIGTNKFIPVIRRGFGPQVTPTFLGTRKYVDFRKDEEFNIKVSELVSDLTGQTSAQKPPLGKIPVYNEPDSKDILPETVNTPEETYSRALELARTENSIGWRKSAQKLNKDMKINLNIFSKTLKINFSTPASVEELCTKVDEALNIITPTVLVALAGVESKKAEFTDQRILVDEFLSLTDWPRAGLTTYTQLPTTLAYVYQALHGAVCCQTLQMDLALKLATMTVTIEGYKSAALWRTTYLVGWPPTLTDCTNAWKFLVSDADRWSWIEPIFGSFEEFKVALIMYYLLLNFLEFLTTIVEDETALKQCQKMRLEIPLTFAYEERSLTENAVKRLARNADFLERMLESHKVTKAKAIELWPDWISICNGWLSQGGFFYAYGLRNMPTDDLMSLVGWQ